VSTFDRKVLAVERALRSFRRVVDRANALHGHAHRLRANGLDDTAKAIEAHVDLIGHAARDLRGAVEDLLATADPSLEETQPSARRPR
jgi:hypothetical protein